RSATLLDEEGLEPAWPPRPRMSHKGDYGHVWIFGGSVGFSGAPMLAAEGAAAAGAGLVSIVCPDEVWPVVASGSLEVMVHPQASAAWRRPEARVDAVVAGPGWGRQQAAMLEELLQTEMPLVLDADALNILAQDAALQRLLTDRSALTVLTPHPGEAARLLQTDTAAVQANRKQAIKALIEAFGCWIVLKGHATLVGSPEGDVYLSPFGSPQMAVGGSGDVLSGVIGAALAGRRRHGLDPGALISAAVVLHGLAGEEAGWYRAGELADRIARRRQGLEGSG
ncbi:MAG: NAD(P)H-hydrate dehydratase, partial [Alphaproteobacteria bacterium]